MFTEEALTGACQVYRCTILQVYPETYTVQVAGIEHQIGPLECKFATPVTHRWGGGLNFMPQAGDICYLFMPSDKSGPFILGYVYTGEPQAVQDFDGIRVPNWHRNDLVFSVL